MFTLEMLRTLKGAPLAVLIALALTRQPAGAEYLARVTGYSDKPTLQALKLLADYGLITRNSRNAWQIAGGALQLPFSLEECSTGEPNIRNVKSRKNSDYHSVVINVNRKDSSPALSNNNINAADSEKFRLNIKTLRDFGIFEPKAREIAAKPWVNPDYIQRHVENVKRDGNGLGLAIFCMLNNHPAPLSEDEKRTEYFRELNRKLNGFAGGEDDEEEE